MASIFPKSDPRDPAMKRWMAKVKIGRDWRTVSLRLRALPGTKREARQRADSLQAEVQAGVLSDYTRGWLGDAAGKLAVAIGRGQAGLGAGAPDTWRAAGEAWLLACAARDSRSVPEGRAKAEETTKVARRFKLKLFLEWAEAEAVPFSSVYTDVAIRFIEHRKAAGIGANTLWNGDLSIVCTFGEWLASKRLCEPINRDRIREVMPPRPDVVVVLPTWRADLANLKFLHEVRRYGPWAAALDGRNRPKMLLSRQSLWSVVLVIRGLGCRPSEASALCWETIDLDAHRVRFVKSKLGRSRTVPILLQWVEDGFRELWEVRGRPRRGPVCVNSEGRIWRKDSNICNLLQDVSAYHGRPLIHLKDLEKLQIAQLIHLGFPPHVVAHWSDHTLTVQERHYYEGGSYLPPEDGYDFGGFGALSEYGRRVLFHQGAYSREMVMP